MFKGEVVYILRLVIWFKVCLAVVNRVTRVGLIVVKIMPEAVSQSGSQAGNTVC